jgi:hypothetical protein
MLLASASEIASLFHSRELIIGRGLAVLSAWALLNLIGSGYMVRSADRRTAAYYFHGMNVSWGAINAALACWGILNLHFRVPAGLGLAELFRTQLYYENLFLFNTGLDVAYVMTGSYLQALAAAPQQRQPVRLLGFGQALWLQGGFLLAFDAAMWLLLHWKGQGLWLLMN